jgi:hypothetical protein
MIVAIFWRVTLLSVPVNAATKCDSCQCRLCFRLLNVTPIEKIIHRKQLLTLHTFLRLKKFDAIRYCDDRGLFFLQSYELCDKSKDVALRRQRWPPMVLLE